VDYFYWQYVAMFTMNISAMQTMGHPMQRSPA
jgi:hypothetical protein